MPLGTSVGCILHLLVICVLQQKRKLPEGRDFVLFTAESSCLERCPEHNGLRKYSRLRELTAWHVTSLLRQMHMMPDNPPVKIPYNRSLQERVTGKNSSTRLRALSDGQKLVGERRQTHRPLVLPSASSLLRRGQDGRPSPSRQGTSEAVLGLGAEAWSERGFL